MSVDKLEVYLSNCEIPRSVFEKEKFQLLVKLILIILCRCLHSLSRSVQQLRTSFQDHAVWKPLMKVRNKRASKFHPFHRAFGEQRQLTALPGLGVRVIFVQSVLNSYCLKLHVLSIMRSAQHTSEVSNLCDREVHAWFSFTK